jgi:hypothetical protein
LKFSNEAVQIGEAGLKKRGAGAFAFPGFLLKRSAIELASGNTEQAIVDANRALSLQKTNAQPGSFSSRTGAAYLALARALHAQGKDDEARVAARSAAEQLSKQSVPTILTPAVLCKSPVPPRINFKNVTPACRVSP